MIGLVRVAAVVALLLLSSGAAAGIEIPPDDGWYRWQTTSVATAADACCHTWRNGVVERCVCDLDQRRYGLSIDADVIGDERLIHVYARIENGTVTRIRALNADCPVSTSTDIVDLGTVAATNSIAWLQSQIDSAPGLAENAIGAIGMHGGDASMRALIGVIENRRFEKSLREHALFWLAQSDSDDAFAYLDRLLSRR